jgi:DNA-binding LytR/AlgR family response regulator
MINCVVIDDDAIVRKLIEEFIRKTKQLNLLGSFENPVIALSELASSNIVDIIFVDVEMPEMSGLELLENLRKNPHVIIISGKDKYAIKAFDYDVSDYLLKPVSYSRFYKAVERTIADIKKSTNDPDCNETETPANKTLFIKENSKLTKLHVSDVYFIEARENYVSIQTYEKRYLIHFTMKAMHAKLPQDIFVRTHRSYIININHINTITGNIISMELKQGKKNIPVGKSYKQGLLDHLNLIN